MYKKIIQKTESLNGVDARCVVQKGKKSSITVEWVCLLVDNKKEDPTCMVPTEMDGIGKRSLSDMHRAPTALDKTQGEKKKLRDPDPKRY